MRDFQKTSPNPSELNQSSSTQMEIAVLLPKRIKKRTKRRTKIVLRGFLGGTVLSGHSIDLDNFPLRGIDFHAAL